MENFQNMDLKKSEQKTNRFVLLMGVKTIVVTLLLTAFMVSCSKDDQQKLKIRLIQQPEFTTNILLCELGELIT